MSQQQDETKRHFHGDTAAEPADGYEPVPLWLFTFFGALLLWGGWYLGAFNGGWNSYELDENARYGAGAASQPAEDPIVLGKRIFSGTCVSCHQADGKGLPGQYPTLNGSEWVAGTPAWMKRIVLNGLEGPITVKGASYNNAMPALGAKLSDKQIAAVISFVRTNTAWGNNSGTVSPESVAATRAVVKSRTTPWSPSELQAITTDEQPAATSAPATTQSTSQPAATTSAPATAATTSAAK